MRTDADRLGDILLAIAKIKERAAVSVDAFERDEMLQVWVIHHLQVIGEAVGSLGARLSHRPNRHRETRATAILDEPRSPRCL